MEIKDWVEFATLIFAIAGTLWAVGRSVGKFEAIGKLQALEISEIQRWVKEMKMEFNVGLGKQNELLVELTKQTGNIRLVEERLLAQGKRIDEMDKKTNEISRGLFKLLTKNQLD